MFGVSNVVSVMHRLGTIVWTDEGMLPACTENGGKMREIELTNVDITLVDDEDYIDVVRYQWYAFENGWGKVYAKCTSHKVSHRLLHNFLLDMIGVDHINGDGLDNRRGNLRLATRSQNAINAKKRKNTTSRFKGVYFDSYTGKWRAAIHRDGKRIHLGRFAVEEDAAFAYNRAAVELFQDFALLNDISDILDA